eukprot:g76187.t1
MHFSCVDFPALSREHRDKSPNASTNTTNRTTDATTPILLQEKTPNIFLPRTENPGRAPGQEPQHHQPDNGRHNPNSAPGQDPQHFPASNSKPGTRPPTAAQIPPT